MSKFNKKSTHIKEELNINISNYDKILESFNPSSINENLQFEIKYFIFCIVIMFSTFTNIYKNNITHYNFKLVIILILYFLRRLISKLWYHYRLSEFFVHPILNITFYIVASIIALDIVYLLISLYLNNSLFHISALLMVAILQLPSVKIFPEKEKRYEGAPQEMIYNIKSKLILNIIKKRYYSYQVSLFTTTYAFQCFSLKRIMCI